MDARISEDPREASMSECEQAARAEGEGRLVVQRSAEPQPTQRRGRARMRCILVHGFNGEPVDMCELERRLSGHGFATSNLLLPGHGTTPRDFAAARWEHWLETVRAEARRSLAHGERVALIGHSMGGALSLVTAATEPGISGVVALCTPLSLDSSMRGFFARMHRLLPYAPSFGEDVRDWFGARRRYERKAYKWTAMATAHSLFSALPTVRQSLPMVACPTLLMYARHDHVVPFADGIEAYKLLGAREKELVALPRSFHAVTKDVERHLVFAQVEEFCAQLRQRTDGTERTARARIQA
jgi:carboxylesterase